MYDVKYDKTLVDQTTFSKQYYILISIIIKTRLEYLILGWVKDLWHFGGVWESDWVWLIYQLDVAFGIVEMIVTWNVQNTTFQINKCISSQNVGPIIYL